MAIDKIIENISILLEDAYELPLIHGKKMVNADKLNELFDRLMQELPGELKQAKKILADKSSILEEADLQANDILRRAEERARQLISQENVTIMAKEYAEELKRKAQADCETLRTVAINQADDYMRMAEESLTTMLDDIKDVRSKIK